MVTYTGYRMTVEVLDDEVVIHRVGMVAKATAAEVRIPLGALIEVRVRDATPLVNGLMQFVLAGNPVPAAPSASDPYTVVFRRKTRDEFAELRQTLEARIERNRAAGVDPSQVAVDRVAGLFEARKADRSERAAGQGFAGITIRNGRIESRHGGGPVAGAHAAVDTAGQLSSRITATRLVLTGPLALAWRKKNDHRELYLLIEGDGWAVSVPVDPTKGTEARDFATKINVLGSRAAAATPAQPARAPARPGGDVKPGSARADREARDSA